MKPGRVIVATGSYENPMIFENKVVRDIYSGCLAASDAWLFLCNHRSYGKRFGTCNEQGYTIARQLIDAGVTISGIIDDRSDKEILSSCEARKLNEANIPLYAGHKLMTAVGQRRSRRFFSNR